MNLLRRKIPVTKVPKQYKNRDVFYIVWHRTDSSEFFLCDAQNDGNDLYWSVFPDRAISFDDGQTALAFCNEIKEKRNGPGIIELKIITQKVDEEDEIWAI